ncbi:MAG: M48 family metallopeptidase [Mycobacteriales bacterium]
MRDPVVLGVTVALVRLAGAAVSGMIALVRERARFRALAALARAAGPGTVLVDRPDGGTLVAVGAGGRVLLALLPGAPHPGPGMPVDRAAAPELWAVVDRLADRARAPAPTEPRLVPAANAAVTEEVFLLGLVVGARRLEVGVPLLLGLTVPEPEAVLCHELGVTRGPPPGARPSVPYPNQVPYPTSVPLPTLAPYPTAVPVPTPIFPMLSSLLGS